MVVFTYNPNAQKIKTRGFLQVSGQPGLHETVPKKKGRREKRKRKKKQGISEGEGDEEGLGER